jgi:hypothetical protein
MRILFVGVFDTANRSTNNAQLRGFLKQKAEVIGVNFRDRRSQIGAAAVDQLIIDSCKSRRPDLVVFSKCAELDPRVFRECSQLTTTCLWWMDPITTLRQHSPDMIEKAGYVSFVCTGIANTMETFEAVNKSVHHVLEGYDTLFHKPYEMDQDLDITFIGSLHSERQKLISQIVHPVIHIDNAYALEHAKTVSRSKINLNFSTAGAASDRVYKVLGAKGFLLTSEWEDRNDLFKDGEDLVIYSDMADLNNKITYYLNNPGERDRIRGQGYRTVQGMTKDAWAAQIIQIYNER